MSLGVNVAVLNDRNEILLVKREDFHVWCMPGGRVELGESLSEAAMRETLEETNIHVQLDYLVGSYSRPNWYDKFYHIMLYRGTPLTDDLIFQKEECVDIGYFAYSDIPNELLIGQRQRIDDVFSNKVGISVQEKNHPPLKDARTIRDSYDLRNDSSLSRLEFYKKNYKEIQDDEIQTETKRTIFV